LGKREFIISTANSGDAENDLKCLIRELAREMSYDAINSEFENPSFAIQHSKNQPWIPFAKGTTIIGTTMDHKISRKHQTKRSRITQDSDHYNGSGDKPIVTHYTPVSPTNGSYTGMAGSNDTKQHTVDTTNTVNQTYAINNPEVTLLKSQFSVLQHTVDTLKTKNFDYC
jgi:hypothetical protein